MLIAQQKFTEETLQCFERAGDQYPLAHLLAARVFIAQGDSGKAKSELQIYLSSAEQVHRDLANSWLGVLDRREQSRAVFPPPLP